MLLHRQKTKKLTLATHDPLRAAVLPTSPDPGSPMRSPMFRQRTRSIGNTRGVPDEMSNGEGRPSLFSKTRERTIRRVKTEEEQRARARKEREHEVDFELHSASGLSSGNNSPEEVGRKLKSDEKWMGELLILSMKVKLTAG